MVGEGGGRGRMVGEGVVIGEEGGGRGRRIRKG